MPTSYLAAIPAILHHVQVENPRSVLDVGIGFGKYGVLLREMLDVPHERYSRGSWRARIDGVEVYESYRNPIHDYVYDRVLYGNILSVIGQLDSYDVILLIDVLEHFNKPDGQVLLRKLLEHANRCVVVSTPLYPAPQGGYAGNGHERHLSRWHLLDFVGFDATYTVVPVGPGGAQVVKLYAPVQQPRGLRADELWSAPVKAQASRLSITYVLPHHRLTGGVKMLLQQMRWLRQRGHLIRVVFRGSGTRRAVPEWAQLVVDEDVVIPPTDGYSRYLRGSDVVVAGWVDQLPELAASGVPTVYWEQGHEWLFGEINVEQVSAVREYLRHAYAQPVALAAASPILTHLLKTRYGREAALWPNGIAITEFKPDSLPGDGSVLLIGNPSLRFKGFDVALRALHRAWELGARFQVNWVCQAPPRFAAQLPFPVQCVVNPSQADIPRWYQRSDLVLFTSWYEGFGMPPLEAMACGVPVVATECGGIDSYASPGVNCLLAEPGDAESLAAGVVYLLQNGAARELLGKRARETALQFAWEKVILRIEHGLRQVSENGNEYAMQADHPGALGRPASAMLQLS